MNKPKPATILIVEDNLHVAQTLCDLMQLEGYDCVVAHSFAQAKARLQAGGIDILISDYHLGDGKGADLLSGLDGNKPPMTILISALLDVSVREHALQTGFHTAIEKEKFNPELLRTLFEQVVRRKDAEPDSA